MTKISIRFYNDREVRAIWDEEKSKWWFSVLDIVGVLNDQNDYQKNRNYWKYLKTKLRKEQSQLVSATNQLKLLAADGKRYATDTLDYDGVLLLAKSFPNTVRCVLSSGLPIATRRLTARASRKLTPSLRAV